MLKLLATLALLLVLSACFGTRRIPYPVRAIRLILGIVYFAAGMSKVIPGFPAIIGPVWLEERLAPYGLGLFARFIAVSEIAIGVLLLTRRFATLGAIALVPMQVCILMVTVSLHWRGTPEILLVFLLLNAVLLAYDYPRWKSLLLLEEPPRDVAITGEFRRGSLFLDVLWIPAMILLLAGSAAAPSASAARYLVGFSSLILLGVTAADWWQSRPPA